MLSLQLTEKPDDNRLRDSTICTTEQFPGRTISKTLGIVEGLSNRLFTDVKNGSLDGLLHDAKSVMMDRASSKGADAVVGFRYEIIGRDIEKTVLVYGTAVQLSKL